MVALKEKKTTANNLDADQATAAMKKSFVAQVGAVIGTTASVALCCVLTVGALEGIFALAHVGEDTVARPDPLLGYAHLENQTVTYRFEGFSCSTINSRGFRDKLYAVPKPAGTTRVCVVGDSMTMGLEVPLQNTFPKLLEKRLQGEGRNVEVLNCGMSGTGTGQQYLGYLQNIAALQPDMLIVAYHLGDTDDNIGGGTNPPRPTFLLGSNNKLQVDFKDMDKWFSGLDARFYASLDWLRRNSRVLAVLNKLDLDLQADPTYLAINKVVKKPISSLWGNYLKTLPTGNWQIERERLVASDLLPENQITTANPAASSSSVAASAKAPASTNTSSTTASFKSSANANTSSATTSTSAPANTNTSTSAAATVVSAKPAAIDPLDLPENGDLKAYRGLLYVHNNRMAVTKEIFRKLNAACNKNHCKLVIAALPAYDNSIMYYREVNELQQLAQEEHFGFINSSSAYPTRGPLDESPFHFAVHFNRAGHARMSETLYQQLFSAGKSAY